MLKVVGLLTSPGVAPGTALACGVDARLIGVHLQEHVADAQSRIAYR
nr:hypothetical protein [Streptomyces odonnellii]